MAKIRLAAALRTQVVIPGLVRVGGKLIDVECELTRDNFNSMIKPLVDHSLDLVHDAIKLARTMQDQIDAVLLVGGSTRVPLVEEEVKKVFGDRVIRGEVNPMHCVAQGAAIETMLVAVDVNEEQVEEAPIIQCKSCEAINLENREDCRSCSNPLKGGKKPKRVEEAPTIICSECNTPSPTSTEKCMNCGHDLPPSGIVVEHMTPHSIGVEVVGDYLEVIIPQQTPFPTTTTKKRYVQILETRKPGQEEAHLPIYEGEGPVAKNNQYLGMAQGKLPAGLPENTKYEVEFAIDKDGILRFLATLPDHRDFKIEASIHLESQKPIEPQTSSISVDIEDDGGGIIGGGEKERVLRAQYMLFLAGGLQQEGEGFVPTAVMDSIMQLAGELLTDVQDDNEKKAEILMKQLEGKLNYHAVYVELAQMRAVAMNTEVTVMVGANLVEKLNHCVEEADPAKQNRNQAGLFMAVESGRPIFIKIMELMTEGGKPPLPGSKSDFRFGGSKVICPKCKKPNPAKAVKCEHCGEVLPQEKASRTL